MRTARLLPVSPSIHCSGGLLVLGAGVPGPGGCTWSLGVYLVQGVYLVPGECTWSWGMYLVMLVYLVWGVVSLVLGEYLVSGGVPGPRGWGCTWSQGGHLPMYSPCEQNDWQTGVKTLPCPKLRLRAVITGNCMPHLVSYYKRKQLALKWLPCQITHQCFLLVEFFENAFNGNVAQKRQLFLIRGKNQKKNSEMLAKSSCNRRSKITNLALHHKTDLRQSSLKVAEFPKFALIHGILLSLLI